jgi:hypothetical protein
VLTSYNYGALSVWSTETRILHLNSTLCKKTEDCEVQESRKQGKFPPITVLFFQTEFAAVFINFGFFVFLFFLVSFQVPLTSCASPWRAGETKNGASPKCCHYHATKLFGAILHL